MSYRTFLCTLLICAVFLGVDSSRSAQAAGFYKSGFTTIDRSFWYVSDGWNNGNWMGCQWVGSYVSTKSGNLVITEQKPGGSVSPIGCGEIRTLQSPGYGIYEARLKTAAGLGLNSAFFTYVGPYNNKPWDEIDMEFLGKDSRSVSLNFFTNGVASGGKVVPLGFDASAGFHNYAIKWEAMRITWYADGKIIYTSNSGAPIPKNAGQMFFSLWSGSSLLNSWLGAYTYTRPSTMEIAWAAYTPLTQKCSFAQSISCK